MALLSPEQQPEVPLTHRLWPGNMVWEGVSQPDEAAHRPQRRYYVIGRRPLDGAPDGLYGKRIRNTLIEHQQFIANDGHNQGLLTNGLQGTFEADKAENMHRYEYRDKKKYDAALIEEAMVLVEAERHARVENRNVENRGLIPHHQSLLSGNEANTYSLSEYHCQDYVDSVLQQAEILSRKKVKSLILSE